MRTYTNSVRVSELHASIAGNVTFEMSPICLKPPSRAAALPNKIEQTKHSRKVGSILNRVHAQFCTGEVIKKLLSCNFNTCALF